MLFSKDNFIFIYNLCLFFNSKEHFIWTVRYYKARKKTKTFQIGIARKTEDGRSRLFYTVFFSHDENHPLR